MKAVFSITGHDNYLFFLPITAMSWQKIGVSCIIFHPLRLLDDPRFCLARSYCPPETIFAPFICPPDAEATYAQVSRLFAAALPGLDQNERLITTDADMMVFGRELLSEVGDIIVFGGDLLEGTQQYPMCYISMTVEMWSYVMAIWTRTYQECLDLALGEEIVNRDMRGNLWARDQELVYRMIQKSEVPVTHVPRKASGGNFATRRVDRDDAYWETAIPNAIDYHMHRPGTNMENLSKLLIVLETRYPNEKFDWILQYSKQYLK